jgi:hypothetical protein
VGGSGAYQNASMVSPMKGTQIFARYDHDLSDTVHAYAQFAANIKNNTSYSGWNQLTGLTVSSSNAFLSSALQSSLAATYGSTFSLNEILSAAPASRTPRHDPALCAGGNRGQAGRLQMVGYSHGASMLHTRVDNQVNYQKLAAALDAVVSPTTGQIVCQASLSNSAYANCVPINLFGATSPSAASLNYVLGSTNFFAHTLENDIDASISGSPFRPGRAMSAWRFRPNGASNSSTHGAMWAAPLCRLHQPALQLFHHQADHAVQRHLPHHRQCGAAKREGSRDRGGGAADPRPAPVQEPGCERRGPLHRLQHQRQIWHLEGGARYQAARHIVARHPGTHAV